MVINEKLDTMMTMNRKLDLLLAFHDEQIPSANCSLDLLPTFPINSLEDFRNFCKDLSENEEVRKQFVSLKLFLLRIG